MTKLFQITLLTSVVLVVGADREEVPGEHSLLPPPTVEPSNSPPDSIPLRDPTSWRAGRFYFAQNSTYNLPDGMFWLFLPDTPKSILFKVRATPLGFDQDFYYFRDAMFDHEWAFGREPADDFFAGHAIWSRPVGQTEWGLQTSEAQLASPAPTLPAPRERSVVSGESREQSILIDGPRREPARVNSQARQQPRTSNEARRRAQAADQSRGRNRASQQRNLPAPERDGLLFGRWRNSERGR